MMRLPAFEYRGARTVEEALDWMAELAGDAEKDPEAGAMLMAGGTDVLPNMKQRIFTPRVVVGLRGVQALRGVTFDGEHGLRVGTGATLRQVAESQLVRRHYPALAEAAESISTPQLRQMGTIGGNLCLDTRCNYYNQSEFWRRARDYCLKKGSEVCRVAPNGTGCYAVSSCDTPAALIALDATVRVASRDGERIVAVADLLNEDGIHPVRLRAGDVLTDVYLPTLATGRDMSRPYWRSTYEKYRVRGSFDFPIASVAAAACFVEGVCTQARLVLQGVAMRPVRVTAAEALLTGRAWTPELLEAAADVAYRAAHPMDNTSGTIALRRRAVRACARRALERLLAPQEQEVAITAAS
jgi:4-hydroxybenzoyl-CoA reductase subunit beta